LGLNKGEYRYYNYLFERPRPILVSLLYFLLGLDLTRVVPSLGSIASTIIGVLVGYLAPLGKVEGFPSPPTLPIHPYTVPTIYSLLLVVPLYIAPFLVLKVLLRL
jgi:hypothetical protein